MALNKTELLNELTLTCDRLNIPHHHIHISHGGAGVINGTREFTNDIDVAVLSPVTWVNILFPLENKIRYNPLGLSVGADAIRVGNIDFHWMDEIDISVDVHDVGGFWVSTKYQVLIERIKLGREKDKEEAVMLYKEYSSRLPEYLNKRFKSLNWDEE